MLVATRGINAVFIPLVLPCRVQAFRLLRAFVVMLRLRSLELANGYVPHAHVAALEGFLR